MKKRILVLGAGFGGHELSTMLSEAFGDDIEVTRCGCRIRNS